MWGGETVCLWDGETICLWDRSSIGLWAVFGAVAVCGNVVIPDLFHSFYFESFEEGEDSMGLVEVIVDCGSLLACSTRKSP